MVPASIPELLGQDALVQAVAGIEHHEQVHLVGLFHLHARHRAGLVVVGDRADGAFFGLQNFEHDLGGGNWNLVAWDNLPEVVLQWARDPKCPDPNMCYWSTMDVFWTVPQSAVPGSYRIRVFGSWKHGVTGAITPYEGTTNPFIVR